MIVAILMFLVIVGWYIPIMINEALNREGSILWSR
jgi:hypothetical protein